MADAQPVGLASGLRACPHCRAIYRKDYVCCPFDGATITEVSRDPMLGAALGSYTIEALLGEGGMGRVYRAHHTTLTRRRVAIKVLLGDLAASQAMRLRFLQEADATSRLDHPNVVSVLDIGRGDDGGPLYLVMDLVDGTPLFDLLLDGPLAPGRAINLARGVFLGLAHAHERGLIHRDLKPDNIIVAGIVAGHVAGNVDDTGGEVARIVDFGLAIIAEPGHESTRLTTQGIMVGTPAYIAPERVTEKDVDHRVDLFAAGVTLYEMLTGLLPDGSQQELLARSRKGEYPSFAERAPGVAFPAGLEAIVRRLMAPDPGQRYATAEEVAERLGRLGDATLVTPAGVVSTKPTTTTRAAGADAGLEADPTPRPRLTTERAAPRSDLDQAPARRRWVPWLVGAGLLAAAGAAAVVLAGGGASPAAEPPAALVARATATTPTSTSDADDAAAAPARGDRPGPGGTTARMSRLDKARGTVVEPDRASLGRRGPERGGRGGEASGPHGPDPAGKGRGTEPDDAGATALASPAPPVDAAPARPTPTAPPPVPSAVSAAISNLVVDGSLANAVIRRAVEKTVPALRTCYLGAARAAGRGPGQRVRVRFEVDDSRRPTGVTTSTADLPTLASCVGRALGGLRTDSAPDVGAAKVSLDVVFAPGQGPT